MNATVELAEAPGLGVETHFAMVPEWVLDSAISDCALRLYAVLVRYGQTSGARVPGRSTLARRLRKQSVDTVDRAMKELVGVGAVEIEHRRQGTRQLTNRYLVRTASPGGGRTDAATPGRTSAAGPEDAAGQSRSSAAGPSRTDAATPAAALRPDPESLTQSPTPPPPARAADAGRTEEADGNQQLLAACGIADLDAYATEVQTLRRQIGQPSVRWTGPCLLAALQLAVKVRGWPAHAARQALLLVTADNRTRSPMRLAEAGPWWDHAAKQTLSRTPQEQAELDGLERLLADCDDRAVLQQQARRQLADDGQPITRLSVARRAARLLEQQTRHAPQPRRQGHEQSEPLPPGVPRERSVQRPAPPIPKAVLHGGYDKIGSSGRAQSSTKSALVKVARVAPSCHDAAASDRAANHRRRHPDAAS